MNEEILFVLGIIGAASFAISGALTAIKAKFDLFGVIIIGCVTATGGGVLRDILIGEIPPMLFKEPYLGGIAAALSVVAFCFIYFKRKDFYRIDEKRERINNVFDSVGLAAFTVTGTELAFSHGISGNVLLSITIGVLTGVGGGILRDVLTGNPPYIFRKHVYAVVAIFGSVIYYVLRLYVLDTLVASAVSMAIIVGARLLATKYRWKLPKINIDD